MKNLVLAILINLVLASFCLCQPIEIEKSIAGYKYSQDGTPIKLKGLIKVLESKNEAYTLIKKAKANHDASNIFGFSGGLILGGSLGSGQLNSRVLTTGAGLIVIAIILSTNSKNKVKKAVGIYNSSIESSSYLSPKSRFRLTTNSNGFGVAMLF